MIRFIAAIDSKRGIADDHGIPWQGKVPTDVDYFRTKTVGSSVLMGSGWYAEQEKPLSNRENLVATTLNEPLRPGFTKVTDARAFLKSAEKDIWVGGGAKLFEGLLDLADELHLTLLEGDFHCTKFFPEYEDRFEMVSASEPITENGITYRFTLWKPKK